MFANLYEDQIKINKIIKIKRNYNFFDILCENRSTIQCQRHT